MNGDDSRSKWKGTRESWDVLLANGQPVPNNWIPTSTKPSMPPRVAEQSPEAIITPFVALLDLHNLLDWTRK